MKAKVTTIALVLLFLTLGAEAELCKARSRTFKGRCTRNDNCVAVCMTENFTGGYCHGVVERHCMCTKKCGEEPPEEPGEPPEEPRQMMA
ncbi:defensin Tk-AMP-D1.1-like [Hordeum vulgare subsp. vulgare]|uniref:Predicted protein n=1 Tax=Hordeum vulgare subsp. vulgare TaxID=112509 RepID=F2EB37_HORVV|nr:defensin Tk-AMP-D1.1-like [Hordeum vulgare subsp. vulgare]KAI4963573.1 hypothetical protein ZWY2020_011352 [Hordeum vulgare]KAI4978161.1 hypothetical protein ZWY2020_014715 [Hordeum vulgare]BAK04559.1 predicted protein [Hordeum vulgare subsp. vulgare]